MQRRNSLAESFKVRFASAFHLFQEVEACDLVIVVPSLRAVVLDWEYCKNSYRALFGLLSGSNIIRESPETIRLIRSFNRANNEISACVDRFHEVIHHELELIDVRLKVVLREAVQLRWSAPGINKGYVEALVSACREAERSLEMIEDASQSCAPDDIRRMVDMANRAFRVYDSVLAEYVLKADGFPA